MPEPATLIYDFGSDWLLLVDAILARFYQNPQANFGELLHLGNSSITHPIYERAQNNNYTQNWPPAPHHALADARALLAGYRAWRTHRENPEFPLRLADDILLSIEEVKAGQVTAYKYGKSKP